MSSIKLGDVPLGLVNEEERSNSGNIVDPASCMAKTEEQEKLMESQQDQNQTTAMKLQSGDNRPKEDDLLNTRICGQNNNSSVITNAYVRPCRKISDEEGKIMENNKIQAGDCDEVSSADNKDSMPRESQTYKEDDGVSELRKFLLEPPPKGTTIGCKIFRNKRGLDQTFYPTYYLHLEKDGRKIYLAGRKQKISFTSNYMLSTDPATFSRRSASYIGEVRSNLFGTKYTIFNHGRNQKGKGADEGRKELAAVVYKTEFLRIQITPTMTIILPDMNLKDERVEIRSETESESLLERWKHYDMTGLIELCTRSPVWSEEEQCYQLDFQGRVAHRSKKNFQIVYQCANSYIVMQFGRVTDEAFAMDYTYPLCAVQAFAIALTVFDRL